MSVLSSPCAELADRVDLQEIPRISDTFKAIWALGNKQLQGAVCLMLHRLALDERFCRQLATEGKSLLVCPSAD